jgi:hypothetical protein
MVSHGNMEGCCRGMRGGGEMRNEILTQCPHCAEKDAEIERLSNELNQSRKLAQLWIYKSARQSQLINELADALAESDPFDRGGGRVECTRGN